jgi:hypothetical protein
MRRVYLREALLLLTIARLAVRFAPPARLFAFVGQPPQRLNRFAREEIDWVAWAVETIAAKSWMRCASLPRAIAAQMMLRRRGIASRLCLGAACDDGRLTAHAWIELGPRVILSDVNGAGFTRLAEFGGT